jgi:hypothetical protein
VLRGRRKFLMIGVTGGGSLLLVAAVWLDVIVQRHRLATWTAVTGGVAMLAGTLWGQLALRRRLTPPPPRRTPPAPPSTPHGSM